MTMKKAELEKQMGLKLAARGKGPDPVGRFGQGAAAAAVDKREQRRLDAAAGLMPFACKLPNDLLEALREKAATHEGGINALVEELLKKGLAKK